MAHTLKPALGNSARGLIAARIHNQATEMIALQFLRIEFLQQTALFSLANLRQRTYVIIAPINEHERKFTTPLSISILAHHATVLDQFYLFVAAHH